MTKAGYGQCDKCGNRQDHPERGANRRRLKVIACQKCGRALCADCLAKMAVDCGVMTEASAGKVADSVSGGEPLEALLLPSGDSELGVCAECTKK